MKEKKISDSLDISYFYISNVPFPLIRGVTSPTRASVGKSPHPPSPCLTSDSAWLKAGTVPFHKIVFLCEITIFPKRFPGSEEENTKYNFGGRRDKVVSVLCNIKQQGLKSIFFSFCFNESQWFKHLIATFLVLHGSLLAVGHCRL